MGTKVKGHRIEDEAIQKKHIKNDVKFNENEDLNLNHPTHDNSNDLSFDQNQVLTQGGNADTLHYHTGGSGGAAGILTRPQIDKTLMNLMLKVNSVETGLDNAIIDQLDDIRDLDHGYNSPIITKIETVDGTTLENSLVEDQTYGYRLSTKIRGKQTNTCHDYFVTIPNDLTFPNTLLTVKLPADNEGYQLFRKNVNVKEYVVSFNDNLNLYSPQEIQLDIIPSEYLTESDYLRIYANETNVRTINDSKNVFRNSVDNYLDFGEFNVNDNYSGEDKILALKTNTTNNKIEDIKITFNSNELDIARDFIVEYSTERSPSIYDDFVWQKLSNVYKKSESEIDFDIVNSEILNNEEYNVHLGFDTLINITGIRITILYKVQACYIEDIYSNNLFATDDNEIGTIYKQLITSFKANDIYSMEYKLRSEINEWPRINMYFKNEKGWYYPDYKRRVNYENSGTPYTFTDKIIRTAIQGISYYNNCDEEHFFTIRLENSNPGEEVTISNMNIVVNNSYNQKDIINHNYETLTELTFNDGKNSITTDERFIETDPFKINNFPSTGLHDIIAPIMTFETIGEVTLEYYSDTHNYTWTADPLVADTKHPGNDGTFSNAYSDRTPCVLYRYEGKRGYSLDHTDFKDNHNDFRKGLTQNILPLDLPHFNVKELEFYIYNSTADNVIDIADIKFHDRREIFNTSFMKEFSDYDNQEYLLNNWSTTDYQSGTYPTSYDPIISTYLLNGPHVVDNLRMELYSSQSYTPKDFKIQITRSSSATLGDPLTSDIWENIQNPYLISKLLEQDKFKGTISSDNGITNNNLYDCELDIGFDPVEIQGIRFIFFEAFLSSAEIRIDNAYLYEATNGNDTYELIKDVSTNQPEVFNITDDNLQNLSSYQLTDLPVNETGTRNVWFNGSKKLLEIIDKTKPGIVETKTIATDGVLNFLMNIQKVSPNEVIDTIETYISNDGGDSYNLVTDFDFVNTLPTIGGDVKFRFILNNNAKLNAYSLLYSL